MSALPKTLPRCLDLDNNPEAWRSTFTLMADGVEIKKFRKSWRWAKYYRRMKRLHPDRDYSLLVTPSRRLLDAVHAGKIKLVD